MGTFTLVQTDKKTGEKHSFPIQIRQGNCLAVFLHVYKFKNLEDPKRCWMHQLINFFGNEQHIKNCLQDHKKDGFKGIFWGDLKNIKLNLYYKPCQTLLKYMTRDGLKVQTYYKEPKQTKTKKAKIIKNKEDEV